MNVVSIEESLTSSRSLPMFATHTTERFRRISAVGTRKASAALMTHISTSRQRLGIEYVLICITSPTTKKKMFCFKIRVDVTINTREGAYDQSVFKELHWNATDWCHEGQGKS